VPLRRFLAHHQVTTAYECGRARLENGELLDNAEADGFDALATTDSNLKYQQNLASRRIAIIVLSTTSWPRIQVLVADIVHAVDAVDAVDAVNVAAPGSYVEAAVP